MRIPELVVTRAAVLLARIATPTLRSVGQNRFSAQLVSGALVVAAGIGSALLVGGVASAADAPPDLGTLTIISTLANPSTGTDITAPKARTTGGCSDPGSVSYELRIFGPTDVPDAQKVFLPDFPIATNQDSGFSKTDPIDIAFGLTFKDAAAARGKTIIPGQYKLTANCLTELSAVGGTFTGSVTFTDATHYVSAGGPSPSPGPSGTPTPSPAPSGTPSPSPAPSGTPTPSPAPSGTPTPTPSGTPTRTPTPTPTPGGGAGGGTGAGSSGTGSGAGLAYTGSPVTTIVAAGVALSALGLVLLLAARRRRVG